MNTSAIIYNVLFCVLCCVLGIVDSINAFEYYYEALFHTQFMRVACLVFILMHPIVLFFYYLIILLYLSYLSDHEFSELTSEFEYYEMIFFRDQAKSSLFKIPFLAIYLAILSYFKFFSLYSLKFIIEKPSNYGVFRNVITTSLHHAVMIQSLFQSFPQIILQALNNLLIMEDKHDFNMRGVFNFSTLFSLAFISTLIILYFREKEIRIKYPENANLNSKQSSNTKNTYNINNSYSNLI
jgi:hypothetical protein